MRRRDFTKLAAGTLAAMTGGAQTSAKPNFVIIYADDLGIGDVGCFGAADAKTPHIDGLAARGARLTNWYTNSPVCSPSRASLLTGKYPQGTGITKVLASTAEMATPGLREGETTLPGELRKLGYRTAHIGKWHLGSAAHSRPLAQGYDEFFGFYSGWLDYYSHRYYRQGGAQQEIFHDLWRNEREEFRDTEYQTEMFAQEAVSVLSRQKPGQPLFMTVAFGAVHYPMMAPAKYMQRYPESMDRERRMHLAVTAALDDAVGVIVNALEKRGMLDNTVIFFQSDNGATQEVRAHSRALPYRGGSNAPFRGFKAGLFEGGIRMPAILTWTKGIPAGQQIDGVGAAMDILPTFLGWAGASVKSTGLDGRSVAGMVQRKEPSPHKTIFWGYAKQLAVREGDWKLILNPPSVPGDKVDADVWLSNLREDPGERTNFAAEQPDIVSRLRRSIEEWSASAGAVSKRS